MAEKELKELLNSEQFIQNLKIYSAKFKANKGFGRWLEEYKRMDKAGLFEPENLKKHYISILNDTNTMKYLYWEAIHYIGAQALNATSDYFNNCYCDIRAITGEIAEDENGEELLYLGLEDARELCKKMNDDIGENLFIVYDSQTNKPI